MPSTARGRRSIRLRRFNYSAPGAYFITLCTHRRAPILAHVSRGALLLSDAGKAVSEEWLRSGAIRSELVLEAFVVMPDHLHGIVLIADTNGHRNREPLTVGSPSQICGPLPRSIGAFIAGFKAAATVRINQLRHSPGAAVWQRNYHEHVIRDAAEFERIRRYIENNPTRWITAARRGSRPS